MRRAVLALAVILSGCAAEQAPVPAPKKAAAPKRIPNHTAQLIQQGLKESRMVTDHLLDSPKLPPGALGEYELKGKKYRMFIADVDTGAEAALILFSYKGTLKDPEYISYMGGYFGSDGTQPVYIFAKRQYLAGVAGLPMAQADKLARELASRLQ